MQSMAMPPGNQQYYNPSAGPSNPSVSYSGPSDPNTPQSSSSSNSIAPISNGPGPSYPNMQYSGGNNPNQVGGYVNGNGQNGNNGVAGGSWMYSGGGGPSAQNDGSPTVTRHPFYQNQQAQGQGPPTFQTQNQQNQIPNHTRASSSNSSNFSQQQQHQRFDPQHQHQQHLQHQHPHQQQHISHPQHPQYHHHNTQTTQPPYSMYQSYYPQYPQMGEPGPATLQNGYNNNNAGYQEGYPIRGGYPGVQQQQQQYGNGGGYTGPVGYEQSGPGNDVNHNMDGNPPRGYPPNGYDGYSNGSGGPPQMNGNGTYNQGYYPPNHPYAYGGGVGVGYGYNPQQNGNAYYGYDYIPPPGPIPTGSTSGQTSSSTKSLNPSAAGFTYIPQQQQQQQQQIPPPRAIQSTEQNSTQDQIPPNDLPPTSKPPSQPPLEPPPLDSSSSSQPSQLNGYPRENGDGNVEQKKAVAPPAFASISSKTPDPPAPIMKNGQISDSITEMKRRMIIPAVVDGEKLKSLGTRRISHTEEEDEDEGIQRKVDGLGLTNTQSKPQPTTSISEAPSTSTSIPPHSSVEEPNGNGGVDKTPSASTSTPRTIQSSSPLASTQPTPKVSTANQSILPSPSHKSQSQSQSSPIKPLQADTTWNFVGPSMSGASSPPSSTTSSSNPQSFAQAMTTPSASSSSTTVAQVENSKKKVISSSSKGITDFSPIRLVGSRPDVSDTGNSYAKKLEGKMPRSVKRVDIPVSNQEEKATRNSKALGRGKGAKIAVGVEKPFNKLPKSGQSTFIFGSIGLSEEETTPVQPPTTTLAEPANITPPISVTSHPTAPTPKAKPASWAALLRPSSRPISRSTSTARDPSIHSSTATSPRRSAIPLEPSTSAGPSQNQSSEVDTSNEITPPSTPRIHQTPQIPPSTSTSIVNGNRPVFNYAAAAAVGAALNPQDELVKILSEGVVKPLGVKSVGLPRGLINTGNMCFANTVLVYCPPFTELFEELGRRLKADLGRKTPLLEAMIIFLREFIPTPIPLPSAPGSISGTSTPRSEISSNHLPNGVMTPRAKRDPTRKDAFIPENVYEAMKENKRFDSMGRGYQEDAEEYLGFFLNTLHEELLFLLSRTHVRINTSTPAQSSIDGDIDTREIERPISPSVTGNTHSGSNGEEGWLEVGKKQKTNVVRTSESRESAISRIFGGTLRSVLHTPGSKDSVTLEPYQPLQLDITSSPDILGALRNISLPEIVPGVWSVPRGCNVDATKTVYVEKFPPVLILHLKRFVYDPLERNVVKRGKPVAYGTELVIPQEIISPGRRAAGQVKYKLFGVVYHHGPSATGGHYTVAVSRQDHSAWLHFDDETVNVVPTDQVVVSPEEVDSGRTQLIGGREKCAYLLFYQRVKA